MIARWREDRFAQPAKQPANVNCIARSNDTLKQASSKERVSLMGFGKDHTVPAMLSVRLSGDKRGTECIRKALVDNFFCCQGIAWQFGHCRFTEKVLQQRPRLEERSSGRRLKLAVRFEEVEQVQPQEVDPERSQERSQAHPRKTLARRVAYLSDHREWEVRATLKTSLRSRGWPRTELLRFGLFCHEMAAQQEAHQHSRVACRPGHSPLGHATLVRSNRHPPPGFNNNHERVDDEEIILRPLKTFGCRDPDSLCCGAEIQSQPFAVTATGTSATMHETWRT